MDSSKSPKSPEPPKKGISFWHLMLGGAVVLALIVVIALVVASIIAWPYVSSFINTVWPYIQMFMPGNNATSLFGLPPGYTILPNGSIKLPNGTIVSPDIMCPGGNCSAFGGWPGGFPEPGTGGLGRTQFSPPLDWNVQPRNLPPGVGFPAGPQPGAPNGPDPSGGNANTCSQFGWPCSATSPCCAGMTCDQFICLGTPQGPAAPGGAAGEPGACRMPNAACDAASPCCAGLTCTNNACTPPPQTCRLPEQTCSQTTPCCAGLSCDNSVCKAPGPPAARMMCEDTDANDNAAAGVTLLIQNNSLVFQTHDECKDANTLYEYDCSGTLVMRNEVPCPNGCERGACKTAPGQAGGAAAANCTDSDGGANFLEFGVVTSNGVNYNDNCTNARFLEEYTCGPNGEAVKTGYSLAAGWRCENGAVGPRPGSAITCNDSDGGNMPDVEGSVRTDDGATHADACTGAETQLEYYCGPNGADSAAHVCRYGCMAGACRPAPPNGGGEAAACKQAQDACGITADGADHGNCCERLICNNNVCQNSPWMRDCKETGACGTVNGIYQGVCCSNICTNNTCQPYGEPGGAPVGQTSNNCTDSDGGRNFNAQGVISYSDGFVAPEICLNTTTMVEYSCSERDLPQYEYYVCPPDKPRCYDAVCIAEAPQDACQPPASMCGISPDGLNHGTCCTGFVCEGGLCKPPLGSEPEPEVTCQPNGAHCGVTADGVQLVGCCSNLCMNGLCVPEGTPKTPEGPSTPSGCMMLNADCIPSNFTGGDPCCAGLSCVDYKCKNLSATTAPPRCTENDNGNNAVMRGTTTVVTSGGSTVNRTDYCDGSVRLHEYFCEPNGTISVIESDCYYGCLEGACRTAPASPSSCMLVNAPCGAGYDPCCAGLFCSATGYCINTSAQTTAPCTETDAGLDEYHAGVTHGSPVIGYATAYDYYDSCRDSSTVDEYYCSQYGNIGMASHNCPYGCQNGACKNQTAQGACTDSDGGLTYNTSGSTTGAMYVGSAAQTYYDSCRDTTTVNEYYCNASGLVALSAYYCPNGCQNGACYVSAPYVQPNCTDSDGGKTYGTRGTVSLGSYNISDACNSNGTLQEYYCVPNGFSSEAYACPAGQTCSNGACAAAGCTDSDGGNNTSVAGTVTTQSYGTYTDSCYDSTHAREYYCAGNSYGVAILTCPGTCSNGACLPLVMGGGDFGSPATCNDTDSGNDPATFGTVTYTGGNAVSDTCTDTSHLREYYCNGAQMTYAAINCSNTCTGGKCTPVRWCRDTDGGRILTVAGTVTTDYGASVTDMCAGTNQVGEYSCSGDYLAFGYENCPAGTHCTAGACVQ